MGAVSPVEASAVCKNAKQYTALSSQPDLWICLLVLGVACLGYVTDALLDNRGTSPAGSWFRAGCFAACAMGIVSYQRFERIKIAKYHGLAMFLLSFVAGSASFVGHAVGAEDGQFSSYQCTQQAVWGILFVGICQQPMLSTLAAGIGRVGVFLITQDPGSSGETMAIVVSNVILPCIISYCQQQRMQRYFELYMEEDLQRSLATEQAQRAEFAEQMKTQFMRYVFHELRVPFNAIALGVDNVQDALNENQNALLSSVADCISRVRRCCGSVSVILKEVLTLAHIEDGSFVLNQRPFPFARKLRGLLQKAAHRARESSLRFNWRIDPNVPSLIWGDWARLRMVVQTMLSNALKFTTQGTIEVKVEVVAAASESPGAHSWLRFCVKDTGVGISDEGQRALFHPYIQVDPSLGTKTVSNTGLQLAICRFVVEAHGGEITCESVLGQGSTFAFTIPIQANLVAQDQAAFGEITVNAVPLAEHLRAMLKGKNVLVVEDSNSSWKMLAMFLRRNGAVAEHAANGKEALRMVDETVKRVDEGVGAPYDIILMDKEMPVMDGVECTKELRSRGMSTLIVGLTGSAMDMAQFKEAGLDAVLTKPLDKEALAEVLDSSNDSRYRELRMMLSSGEFPGHSSNTDRSHGQPGSSSVASVDSGGSTRSNGVMRSDVVHTSEWLERTWTNGSSSSTGSVGSRRSSNTTRNGSSLVDRARSDLSALFARRRSSSTGTPFPPSSSTQAEARPPPNTPRSTVGNFMDQRSRAASTDDEHREPGALQHAILPQRVLLAEGETGRGPVLSSPRPSQVQPGGTGNSDTESKASSRGRGFFSGYSSADTKTTDSSSKTSGSNGGSVVDGNPSAFRGSSNFGSELGSSNFGSNVDSSNFGSNMGSSFRGSSNFGSNLGSSFRGSSNFGSNVDSNLSNFRGSGSSFSLNFDTSITRASGNPSSGLATIMGTPHDPYRSTNDQGGCTAPTQAQPSPLRQTSATGHTNETGPVDGKGASVNETIDKDDSSADDERRKSISTRWDEETRSASRTPQLMHESSHRARLLLVAADASGPLLSSPLARATSQPGNRLAPRSPALAPTPIAAGTPPGMTSSQ